MGVVFLDVLGTDILDPTASAGVNGDGVIGP
jgi:hypothetical protein